MPRVQNPDRQRRHGVTELERKQIRDYHYKHPEYTQQKLANWASDKFRRSIGQNLISVSLSSRYQHLDGIRLRKGHGGRERRRHAEHPLLDEVLFEWHQYMQSARVPVTGEMIQEAAKQLWLSIPALACKQMPAFSDGWLDGWKTRNGVRKHK